MRNAKDVCNDTINKIKESNEFKTIIDLIQKGIDEASANKKFRIDFKFCIYYKDVNDEKPILALDSTEIGTFGLTYIFDLTWLVKRHLESYGYSANFSNYSSSQTLYVYWGK